MSVDIEDERKFFSIITVVLNDVSGLSATTESLLAQTYKNYEFIIIDGDSDDGTDLYLDSLRANSNVTIQSGKDDGIYDAMNIGLSFSRAQYVVFMNAGDVFADTNSLQRVADFVGDMGSAPDVIFGGAKILFRSGKSFYRGPRSFSGYIWHGLPANHQATYYRRSILGEQPYDTRYKICSDYYLDCMLYMKNVSSAILDIPLVVFRVGDTSYNNPWLVLSEAYFIQRDVLALSVVMRVVSYIRRILAISAALVLNK